jgi:hypothetical protein
MGAVRIISLTTINSIYLEECDMTEKTQQTGEAEEQTSQQAHANPWEDVVRDFQSLGQNIANAINSSLNEDRTRERLRDLQANLDAVSNQVADSIDEAFKSPPVESAKTEVKKAVDEARDFGTKTYGEAKPHLINVLESLNHGIQTIIDRLQESESQTQASAEKTTEQE